MEQLSQVEPALNLAEVAEWATLLLPDGPGHAVVSWPSGATWNSRAFDTGDPNYLDQLCAFVERIQKSRPKGIYLRIATTSEPPEQGKRGERDLSNSLPCFWLDMDIDGPGHKGGSHKLPLPPDETTCWQIIQHSGLPMPTLWIHSGGGLYPIWFFTQPVELTDDNREHWTTLSEQWNKIFIRAANDLGWHLDSTHNLDRVLRIPGTVNYKVPSAPTQAQFFHRELSADTFTHSEIETITKEGLTIWPDPEPVIRPFPPARERVAGTGAVLPGDDFNAKMTPDRFFHEILEPEGWTYHSRDSKATYLTRPGKDAKDGLSASLNLNGSGNLYVMSSAAAPFEPDQPYTPYAAYTLLTYGSTQPSAFRQAAKDLGQRGYGTPLQRTGFAGLAGAPRTSSTTSPVLEVTEETTVALMSAATETVPASADADSPQAPKFGPKWRKHSLDDRGNAMRLHDRYANQLRWVDKLGKWATWDGQRWVLGGVGGSDAVQLAGLMTDSLIDEEGEMYSQEEKTGSQGRPIASDFERFVKHVGASRATPRIKAMLEQLKGMPGISVSPMDFDRDAYLINVANGILDLRTKQLSPHDPARMMMHLIPVNWNPDAKCPQFDAFLARCQPSEEMRKYLQRIAGYSLTADISEQTIFVHLGPGANGKSVFMELMALMMDTYYQPIPSSTLLQSSHGGEGIPSDIAAMAGARLLVLSETAKNKVLNEERLKQLTGGDRIQVRRLYGDWFKMTCTGKIHLVTNHMPSLSDAPSTWRRFRVCAWDIVIPKDEWIKNLPAKLFEAEAEGILAWMVAGAAAWLEEGHLAEPQQVTEQTAVQREELDSLGEFIMEHCEIGEELTESCSKLNAAYGEWALRYRQRYPMNQRQLMSALIERPGIERHHTREYRGVRGIRVKVRAPGEFVISGERSARE